MPFTIIYLKTDGENKRGMQGAMSPGIFFAKKRLGIVDFASNHPNMKPEKQVKKAEVAEEIAKEIIERPKAQPVKKQMGRPKKKK